MVAMHVGNTVMWILNRGAPCCSWRKSPEAGNCRADGTVQAANITLPWQECRGCILRLQREALEWGVTYLFTSCALVDIVKV